MRTYFLNDLLRGDVDDAHLAGHVHVVVLGDVEAGRSQTVTVQDGTNVLTVSKGQQGCEKTQDWSCL